MFRISSEKSYFEENKVFIISCGIFIISYEIELFSRSSRIIGEDLGDPRSDRIYSSGIRGVKKGPGPRGSRDEEFLVPFLKPTTFCFSGFTRSSSFPMEIILCSPCNVFNTWCWKQVNVSFEAFLVGNQGWPIKGQMLR